MSFFKTKCPGCGIEYWFGIVGMTQIGDNHICPEPEKRAKAIKEAILKFPKLNDMPSLPQEHYE